jgi:hypothetical protein
MTIALYHYFAFLYSLICLLICPSRIKPSRALGGWRGSGLVDSRTKDARAL